MKKMAPPHLTSCELWHMHYALPRFCSEQLYICSINPGASKNCKSELILFNESTSNIYRLNWSLVSFKFGLDHRQCGN